MGWSLRIRRAFNAVFGRTTRQQDASRQERPNRPPVFELTPHEVSQPYTDAKARILAVASARNGGRLQVVAESGYGKTRLLREVVEQLRDSGYVSLFATAPPPNSEHAGASTELDTLLRAKADCVAVINRLAADLFIQKNVDIVGETADVGKFHERLRQAATAQYQAPEVTIKIESSIHVEGSQHVEISDSANQTVTVNVDDVGRSKLDLEVMRTGFVSALADLSRLVPLAILVDDLQLLTGGVSDVWLEDAFEQLGGALTLTASWTVSGDEDLPHGEIVKLGQFSEAEAMDYACQKLCPLKWSVEAAAEAGRQLRAASGRPFDIAETCLSVAGIIDPCDDPAVARERVRELIGQDMETGRHRRARASVDRTATRFASAPIKVFDNLAVLRRFTPEIAKAVLSGVDGGEAFIGSPGFDDFYDWLSKADGYITKIDDGSVVKRREDADAASEADDDDDVSGDYYWERGVGYAPPEQRLHDLIRNGANSEYAEKPQRMSALHKAAEGYYQGKINFDSPVEEDSIYLASARYENPEWQQETREWIFHAARLSLEDFTGTRNAMIRLFFEAFWWWDAEVPSSYCDTLIADLRTLPDSLKGQWVDQLDDFRRGYVPGRSNQVAGRDRDRWKQADDALLLLRKSLGLKKKTPPPEEDRDLRTIYIITSCLRADTKWFGSTGRETDRENAATWLSLGAKACTHEADHWIGSWAIFLEADLWAPVDPERALELLADLPERIEEDEDHELLAMTGLLHADIAWQDGRRRLAFDIYTRTALHFFVYHIRQEVDQQAPNPYTVSRYEAIRSTLRSRLAEALADGEEELVRIARIRIREYFAPYWERVGAEPEDTLGLPPQPRRKDLGSISSEYAADALSILEEMGDELVEDMQLPLAGLPTPWPSGEAEEAA